MEYKKINYKDIINNTLYSPKKCTSVSIDLEVNRRLEEKRIKKLKLEEKKRKKKEKEKISFKNFIKSFNIKDNNNEEKKDKNSFIEKPKRKIPPMFNQDYMGQDYMNKDYMGQDYINKDYMSEYYISKSTVDKNYRDYMDQDYMFYDKNMEETPKEYMGQDYISRMSWDNNDIKEKSKVDNKLKQNIPVIDNINDKNNKNNFFLNPLLKNEEEEDN